MGLLKPRRSVQRSVSELIDAHMSEIKAQFPDAKLTLVIRTPILQTPVIFTNDEPAAAIKAINEMTDIKGPNVQVRN